MTITNNVRRLALVGLLAMLASLLPLSGAIAQTPPADDGTDDALNLTGENNVEFAVRWSQVLYTPLGAEGPMTPPAEVRLGRDDLFADNLASGAIQGAAAEDEDGAPLLLTDTDSLSEETLDELNRLSRRGNNETDTDGDGTVDAGVEDDDEDLTVTILGDLEAISQNVEDELTDAGFTTERFGGETRIETAIEIAESDDTADTVLVVRAFPSDSGDETQAFADSLGAGALAATNEWDILFTQTEVLTGNTEQALMDAGYDSAVVVGGTDAISSDVEASVSAIVSDTTRVGGETRFETAIELNDLRESDGDGDIVLLIDGQDDDAWADGFPAANISGLNNYPVVLSNQGMIPQPTEDFLTEFGANGGATFAAHLTDIVLICGNTVDADVCQEALNLINGNEDGEVREFPPTDAPPAGQPDNPTFTDAPELVRVETVSQRNDSVNLRFVFDEQITGRSPQPGCFHLYAFDQGDFTTGQNVCNGHAGDDNTNTASVDGSTAIIDSNNSSAAIVNFQIDEVDMSGITVATVDWDAVRDDDGIENLEGNFPINDVTIEAGVTEAPDLAEVRNFDATEETVDFVFDEDVESAGIDDAGTPTDDSDDSVTLPGGTVAGNFVLIDDDGNRMESVSAVRDDDSDNIVRVTFADVTTTTAANTARGVALADAVTEEGGTATNPLQTVDVNFAGNTDGPDLVTVEFDLDEDNAIYTFDAAIALDGMGEDFQVYDRNGDETDGTTAERSATNNTQVVVSFNSELDGAVGASVDMDAVSSVVGSVQEGNNEDEVAVTGQTFTAGETLGPDLVSAEVRLGGNLTGGQLVVVYTFDEDVESEDASRFFVYDEDGAPTRGATAAIGDEDNEVEVTFNDNDDTITDSVAATVNDKAVTDDGGVFNVEAAAELTDAR